MTLTQPSLLRRLILPLVALFLVACADGSVLDEERTELGDFRLGHNIVVAGNAQMGPLSRSVEASAWEESLRGEVARRFARYEGTRLYHIAIGVDGYVLALPGVPLVAAPRSALIIGVHIWDDELGRPINEEREQFTVFEDLTGGTLIGSGLTRTAEEQMASLSRNAVLMIENWLAENPQWFNTTATAEMETEALAEAETTPEIRTQAPPPRP